MNGKEKRQMEMDENVGFAILLLGQMVSLLIGIALGRWLSKNE